MYAVSINVFSECEDGKDPTFVFETFEETMSLAKIILDNVMTVYITKDDESDLKE